MDFRTLTDLHHALKQKTFSSVELTQHYLKRIHQYHYLNAYISINGEQALEEAKRADERLQNGTASPLTGIPMAHKDIFCTKSMPTTCGSKMLANFQAPYQATIVQQLEHEGVIVLGKTNMDEFAMGSTNETSFFGPTKNPWKMDHVPGGSSGGSAAAVSASLAVFATGSDTGGSIRQPAAFCGISGLKPTYGLLSRFGMVAYASSLDQAGIMGRSAEDLALILQAMAGYDRKDSTSANRQVPNYLESVQKPMTNVKIGLPRCFFHPDVEADIQNAVLESIQCYERLGAKIIEVDLHHQPHWIPCYYIIACAEASSNLSRYDGIRYGHRSKHTASLRELIIHSRQEGFGAEVQRRILMGTHVLSAGFYDAYYVKAQQIRRLIRDELLKTLTQVDAILGPTTPTAAFQLGCQSMNPTHHYLADTFTVGANLAGLPALSIPGGFNSKGLPIGIQLIAHHFNEARLLQMAHHFQKATDWHTKQPSLSEEKS